VNRIYTKNYIYIKALQNYIYMKALQVPENRPRKYCLEANFVV